MAWIDVPCSDATTTNAHAECKTFRERFDAINTAALAHASGAIYFYGHWNPNGGNLGETWKFSNLADQVLSARLGLLSPHAIGNSPVSYRVMEGAIRLQLSRTTKRGDGDYWMWNEIGYASAELLAAIRATNPHAGNNPEEVLSAARRDPFVTAIAAATPELYRALIGAGEQFSDEQFPCEQCGSRTADYSYGMFYAGELCAAGDCKRCCVCYLIQTEPGELCAELLKAEEVKVSELEPQELRRAVHKLRKRLAG